jgi:hypothetical protein
VLAWQKIARVPTMDKLKNPAGLQGSVLFWRGSSLNLFFHAFYFLLN